MNPIVTFLSKSQQTYECQKAMRPIVYQARNSLAAGDGALQTQVQLASGDQAYSGGQIFADGCLDVEVTITYLIGDDCDECTVDTLTPVTETYVVWANTAFQIPDGFWSQIDYQLVDAAGAGTVLGNGQTETVYFVSSYTPACPKCIKLVP